MHISRVQIKNFRNFSSVDVRLGPNVVLLGENRVGKSNFLFALRLVLDADLPDRARQLRIADIHDGCDLASDPEITVHLDFSDFEKDPNLLALLTDFRAPEDHTVARLSYVLRKKAETVGPARSDSDLEFKIFGGGDETRTIRNEVRRRISLDLLNALRDAEAELASWRTSPLRPLVEDALAAVQKPDLDEIAGTLNDATAKLGALAPVAALEASVRDQIAGLAGSAHDIKAKLGFAPSDPLRVMRSIAVFIDEGRRGLADASLGSSNLALLALKLAEFTWRREKNERNHTILCVEEPEAHLHPQLQRRIFNRLFGQDADPSRSIVLTTHSPNIASAVSLKSIVLLRRNTTGTSAHALAHLPVSGLDLEDLQHYLHATRAEIFFARGVIFVEGDAEEALLPVFATSCGHDLDELGITVCNVSGVNFAPYVKLAAALGLPFSVITDWDPLDGSKPPLGIKRTLDMFDAMRAGQGFAPLAEQDRANAAAASSSDFRAAAADHGYFLNESTLELELAETPDLVDRLLDVLEAENFGSTRRGRIASWKAKSVPIDAEQLMAMVRDIGKGRLATRLAGRLADVAPPKYITDAINFVASRVQS